MNRYANLAKQRVIAPNEPSILRSKEGRHSADSNAIKRSCIQPFEEDRLRNKDYISTNATQPNQRTSKLTMGELILNKKRITKASRGV